jgi:hypothetical protein
MANPTSTLYNGCHPLINSQCYNTPPYVCAWNPSTSTCTWPTNTPVPTATPVNPSSITASKGDFAGLVYLNWNRVSGTSINYNLERSVRGAGSWTCSATVGNSVAGSPVTFNDTGDVLSGSSCSLVDRQEYDYRVRTIGNSSWVTDWGYSDRCPSTIVIPPPSNLTIDANKIGTSYGNPANLLWKDSSLTGTSWEHGFEIEQNGVGLGTTVSCWNYTLGEAYPFNSCSTDSVIPIVDSLYNWPYKTVNLTDYCPSEIKNSFRVRAFCNDKNNTKRYSAWSSYLSDICSAGGIVSGLAVNLTPISGSYNASLTWTNDCPYGAICSYSIYRCNRAGSSNLCSDCTLSSAKISTQTTAGYIDTGLDSTNYCYRVDSTADSCPRTCLVASPTPTPTISCPNCPLINDEVLGDDMVTLSWGPVVNWGESLGTEYNNIDLYIYTNVARTEFFTGYGPKTLPPTATGEIVTGLTEGATYYWEIKLRNGR